MLVAFMDQMNEPAGAVSDLPAGAKAPEGFEAFFQAEHARLQRALFLVTGDRQEAEELMQDAFLAVWERWERVKAMESPTGYLYRTAMNAVRSRARRAARVAKRLIVRGLGADEFAAADERDALSRALSSLTPRQRAALVLTELLDYSSEEAGRLMHVKPVTVRVLASQGRAGLKEVLEP